MRNLDKIIKNNIIDGVGLLTTFSGAYMLNDAIQDSNFLQGTLGAGLLFAGYKILKYMFRKDFKHKRKY